MPGKETINCLATSALFSLSPSLSPSLALCFSLPFFAFFFFFLDSKHCRLIRREEQGHPDAHWACLSPPLHAHCGNANAIGQSAKASTLHNQEHATASHSSAALLSSTPVSASNCQVWCRGWGQDSNTGDNGLNLNSKKINKNYSVGENTRSTNTARQDMIRKHQGYSTTSSTRQRTLGTINREANEEDNEGGQSVHIN